MKQLKFYVSRLPLPNMTED